MKKVGLDEAGPRLFLSIVSAAEIRAGIVKVEREGAISKARWLAEWWDSIEHLYAEKLLPVDLECARMAGEILDSARAHRPGFEDIAIAAMARARSDRADPQSPPFRTAWRPGDRSFCEATGLGQGFS